jgi:predicted glycoside hydrolase/deacetylase ChbG (UPF0249 family)
MGQILVNADDAGLHPSVDAGIQQCIDAGIVNSVSVINNSQDVNLSLIKEWNEQGIKTGAHIAWMGENWLTKPYFFFDWKAFITAFIFRGSEFRAEAYAEGKAQIERMAGPGISISHIDSHQHVHHFPWLWDVSMRLKEEYKIPRIRCAKAINYSYVRKNFSGIGLQLLASSRFNEQMLPCGGLKYSGNYSAAQLLEEIETYEGKNVELIVHPGLSNDELNKRYRHWNFDWEKELRAVLSIQPLNALPPKMAG